MVVISTHGMTGWHPLVFRSIAKGCEAGGLPAAASAAQKNPRGRVKAKSGESEW